MSQDPILIVGSGLAGLLTALHLAPQPVILLTAGSLGALSSSAWAQGGIAAAVGADDSPALHLADTLAAGAGLCDPAAAAQIIEAGPAAIETLARLGARFDQDGQGRLQLGLEAAHSRRRIVHAAGDGTGREVVRALVEAVAATSSVSVMEGLAARWLLMQGGRVSGVLAQGAGGCVALAASRVVLATGGIGGLFRHTTNPAGAYGAGLAMAARAGAALRGMEFVQFHPTALAIGRDPMPLVSEAVRGEGAVLRDGTGEPVMRGFARGDLEPRDVVSREVWRVLAEGGAVQLDATGVPGFAVHFPAIHAVCATAGIDPARQLIPVRPAAHYHMGGVAVDGRGRTSLPGLWACGEVACTGLHGANRLASNSLLEAAVCARFVADDVSGTAARGCRLADTAAPPPADAARVRPIVSRHLGVLRDAAGLEAAVQALSRMACGTDAASDPALVGLLVAVAALRRPEQVGSHWRTDAIRGVPAPLAELTWADALAETRELAGDYPILARSA